MSDFISSCLEGTESDTSAKAEDAASDAATDTSAKAEDAVTDAASDAATDTSAKAEDVASDTSAKAEDAVTDTSAKAEDAVTDAATDTSVNMTSQTDIGGGAGRRRENQDVIDTFKCNQLHIIGIYDGHGSEYGHTIAVKFSKFVKREFNKNISLLNTDPKKLLEKIFHEGNEMICHEYSNGGTTSTICIFDPLSGIITIGNLGDSTAVLFSNDNILSNALCISSTDPIDNILPLNYLQLTNDHSPEDPKEKEHFLSSGRSDVEYLYDSPSGHRYPIYNESGEIWAVLKDPTDPKKGYHSKGGMYFKNISRHWASLILTESGPLAMTRSIGDRGISSGIPTIRQYDISSLPKDTLLILCIATDGVWDNWSMEKIHEFLFHSSCIDALSTEGGYQKVTDSFMERSMLYARRNFGSNCDNSTVGCMFISR